MYGPAVRRKRFSSSCRLCGLASMYPASVWSVCSGPPWISARLRSHYRPSLKWAIWGTSVRKRREDRSSISSHPLADLGGKQNVVLRHRLLLIGPRWHVGEPRLYLAARPFLPQHDRAALIEADDMERILADIDAYRCDGRIGLVGHGSAPLKCPPRATHR